MNINIENLSKTLNMERLKKDSTFTLLSKLGYTYGFTKDRDYRVLNVLEDDYGYVAEDYQYIVEDNSGKACTIHKGHFYSVTKEDLLPTTSTEDESVVEDVPEWMEGFEDLVRSDYKPSHADYLVSDKLSDEQRTFLQNMLETYSGSTFTCKQNISVVWNNEYQHFVGSGTLVGGKEITFNDLFIPKSQ